MSIFDMFLQAAQSAQGALSSAQLPAAGTGAGGPAGQYSTGAWGPGAGNPQAATPQQTMGGDGGMPQMPQPAGGDMKDVSGFANYGMNAPELPNAQQGIAALMQMLGDPHANRKEDPFQQQQQGGIMQYLQSLGV